MFSPHAVVDVPLVSVMIPKMVPPINPKGIAKIKKIPPKKMMNGSVRRNWMNPPMVFQTSMSGSCKMKNGKSRMFKNDNGHMT